VDEEKATAGGLKKKVATRTGGSGENVKEVVVAETIKRKEKRQKVQKEFLRRVAANGSGSVLRKGRRLARRKSLFVTGSGRRGAMEEENSRSK